MGRQEVVVSAGGGGVGIDLLRVGTRGAVEVPVRASDLASAGRPEHSRSGYRAPAARGGPAAIVERSRVDFGALLRRAFISVSQGGYNTVLDVVTSGARPVVVPFTGNGETEQRARGVRLGEFDLAIVVDDRTYSPEILAAAVDCGRNP